ncbi:MAG: class I SAM-dependent methyltransferase [Actinobacteria bacterium]|nr:class I SAM-dependent methyltransferase [Actinomycetota bacterium]
MLKLTCSRAGIEDDMRVLDLGCGWSSVSLWIAERFPGCRVTAVSSSRDQGRFIADTAAGRGLDTVTVQTADVSTFDPGCRFDRIVSVEMLEHVRNYPAALARIAGWLEPDGACFIHVFSHRRFAYLFDESARGDWMARDFFAGGAMPSHDLLPGLAAGSRRRHAGGPSSGPPERGRPPDSRGPAEPTGCVDAADLPGLRCVAGWWLPGTHYALTLEARRARYDAACIEIEPIPTDVYGAPAAAAWHARRRLFFISCAETFGFRDGREWGVSHYLLRRAHPACEPTTPGWTR